MRTESLLRELGARLRRARAERDITLTELASRSGLSRRYLTEAEAGRANVSIVKLARIAHVLGRSLGSLCDLSTGATSPRRIALVGLRGAGKSTVGRRLALELEVPFTELDREIESRSGLTLAEIFSIEGEEGYARLEVEALEAWLRSTGAGVLATGGSLVTRPDVWQRLRDTCTTVWLRAAPEDHFARVLSQGDTRPMAENPRAMEQLRDILSRREPRYAEADLRVETGAHTIEEVTVEVGKLLGESLLR